LCLDFYLLSPIHMSLNREQVVFLILDWSSGAMLMRIFYNIFLLMPNRRIGQMLLQARDGGLFNMDLFGLNRNIFFPIITCFGGLLTLPFFARVFEIVQGLEN
jgi:hypothetical protein